MIDPMAIVDLADKVGAIDAVKSRLLNQPDAAAEKLAESLEEFYKIFLALDDEVVRYLSQNFESEAAVIEARAVLLGMEVGQSRIRMHEARGSCAKMKNIYAKNLNGWFDRVLGDSVEKQRVKDIFGRLGTTDDAAVRAVDEVAAWLTSEAEQTLDLVDADNRLGAKQRVRQALLDAKPVRLKLTEAMSQLRAMQVDFIAASKTV
jgi:hypothetical protein